MKNGVDKNVADKMSTWGMEALSDADLLTLLTGDEQLAEALLAACGGSLARLTAEPEARLRMIAGLGLQRARLLLVSAEFGRRAAMARALTAEVIKTSDDAVKLFRPMLLHHAHEECWAIHLTSSNRIAGYQPISKGGVQGTVVDHRIIIKHALKLLASQIILIHNHPSGAAEASPQDIDLTEKVARAAALFDIRLLDHLIISLEGEFSFRRAGLLK